MLGSRGRESRNPICQRELDFDIWAEIWGLPRKCFHQIRYEAQTRGMYITQQEVIRASSCSSSLLATSVRKSDNPIILLFSGKGRGIIDSVNKLTIPSQANVILSEDNWHILSSIAGCTLALMVKRFSAMLASKSTYTFQFRNEWKQS